MNYIKNVKLHIKYKTIASMAYAILLIPILIFFLGWLKWYYTLLFSFILLASMWLVYRSDYLNRTESLDIPLKTLICIAIIIGLWILITGNCGVSVSNYDTPWRRAVLRDLIDFEWPVYYEKTSNYLVYYHVFWMVPALIGKVFGWHAALISQAAWLWLIIMVSFLLIAFLLRADSSKLLFLICALIIGWSGLNALGCIFMQQAGWNLYEFGLGLNENYCDALFNGESFNFYYRSNEDFLCENYNQLPIWLVVPLMLENRKIKNYAFIGILLLPYSPWGVIGIAILMIIDAIHQAIEYFKNKHIKELFLEIFSIPNICILASVGVVFGFYFSGTSRLSDGSASFGILTLSKFDIPRIIGLIVFWLCEFGIYYIFLWRNNKKDHLFTWSLPALMVIPICWAGSIWGRDFCMNVSLPILYMLMIYMIIYLKDHVVGKVLTFKNLLLLVCLFIAFSTPVLDWGSKIQTMIVNQSIAVTDDHYYTFSDKAITDDASFANFLVNDSGLFKYISKRCM